MSSAFQISTYSKLLDVVWSVTSNDSPGTLIYSQVYLQIIYYLSYCNAINQRGLNKLENSRNFSQSGPWSSDVAEGK